MSTRYNVGDRVVIVNSRTLRMNEDGEMDRYLGTIMTIKSISPSPIFPYRMVEDQNDPNRAGGGWSWDDGMIDHEATAKLANPDPEPEESGEYNEDYYTDKVYNMFKRLSGEGKLLGNAGKYTKDGIRQNVKEWLKNKTEMFKLLRKHPNWNEEAKAVVYLNTEHRIPSFDDARSAFNNLWNICCYEDSQSQETPIRNITNFFDNMTKEDWNTLVSKSKIFDYCYVPDYVDGCQLFSALFTAIFKQEKMNSISEPVANCINTIFPDLKIHIGQKSSRVMNKLFVKFGFDKTLSYNRTFAKLADSINPFDVERITVLSANIIDFLLMSNGNSWASCHTIISKCGATYGGCYMGGTLSYANDSESLILYTVDKSYTGTDWCFEPKITRQVFFWDYPVLVQERLYPQCNDNGEQGKALVKQYRTVVEDIVSTCLETPNLWVKENRNRANIYSRPDTFMYHDWSCFPNYIVHIKKETAISDTEVEEGADMETYDSRYLVRSSKKIMVGGPSFCINCGEQKCEDDYDDGDNSHNGLLCANCHPDENNSECYECGQYHDLEDMHEINGHYYCDECCFYCDYHEEYEIGDYEYVEGYGVVCADGLEYGNFYHCDHCGGWYCKPTTTATDRWGSEVEICNNCLSNFYTSCDDCGEFFNHRNLHSLGSCWLCSDCYDRRLENSDDSENSSDDEEVTA